MDKACSRTFHTLNFTQRSRYGVEQNRTAAGEQTPKQPNMVHTDLLSSSSVLVTLKKTTDTIQNHKPHLVQSHLTKKDFDQFLRINSSILCNIITNKSDKSGLSVSQNAGLNQDLHNTNTNKSTRSNSTDWDTNGRGARCDPEEIGQCQALAFFLEPVGFLISAPDSVIYQVERAWYMRLLQPPTGYTLQAVGKSRGLEGLSSGGAREKGGTGRKQNKSQRFAGESCQFCEFRFAIFAIAAFVLTCVEFPGN